MLIFEYEGGWGYLARRKGVGGSLKKPGVFMGLAKKIARKRKFLRKIVCITLA